MNTLRRSDWVFGILVLIGLYSLIGFEWLPGLLIFLVGAGGVIRNTSRWAS